jgi:hypothetical protein
MTSHNVMQALNMSWSYHLARATNALRTTNGCRSNEAKALSEIIKAANLSRLAAGGRGAETLDPRTAIRRNQNGEENGEIGEIGGIARSTAMP